MTRNLNSQISARKNASKSSTVRWLFHLNLTLTSPRETSRMSPLKLRTPTSEMPAHTPPSLPRDHHWPSPRDNQMWHPLHKLRAVTSDLPSWQEEHLLPLSRSWWSLAESSKVKPLQRSKPSTPERPTKLLPSTKDKHSQLTLCKKRPHRRNKTLRRSPPSWCSAESQLLQPLPRILSPRLPTTKRLPARSTRCSPWLPPWATLRLCIEENTRSYREQTKPNLQTK